MSRLNSFHHGLGQGHVEPASERRKYVPRGIKAKSGSAAYHREYRSQRKQEAEAKDRKLADYEKMLRFPT